MTRSADLANKADQHRSHRPAWTLSERDGLAAAARSVRLHGLEGPKLRGLKPRLDREGRAAKVSPRPGCVLMRPTASRKEYDEKKCGNIQEQASTHANIQAATKGRYVRPDRPYGR